MDQRPQHKANHTEPDLRESGKYTWPVFLKQLLDPDRIATEEHIKLYSKFRKIFYAHSSLMEMNSTFLPTRF